MLMERISRLYFIPKSLTNKIKLWTLSELTSIRKLLFSKSDLIKIISVESIKSRIEFNNLGLSLVSCEFTDF